MNINNIYKSIDLHGECLDIAKILVDEFINDYLGKEKKLVIIHGIGTGILRRGIHNQLKHDKRIAEYKLDNMNPGQTIITLKDIK